MNDIMALLAGCSLFAAPFVALSIFWLRMACRWRAAARSFEAEANQAADENTRLHGLLEQARHYLDDSSEAIVKLTVQRDEARRERDWMNEERVQFAKVTREAQDALRRWAIDNPGRAIRDLNELANKAYVHGPRGRLTRFVPKAPTNG